MLPFRDYHLLNLLTAYEQQTLPLDLFISDYFKANKALGSKDRGYIAETVYALIRWLGLIDFLSGNEPTWEKRLGILRKTDLAAARTDDSIPLHIRYSFPKALFERLLESHGNEKGKELCLICNQPAPVTVRINPTKTTRDELIKRWQPYYEVVPCRFSKLGITFLKRINFFGLPEFKAGLFEVQDEGSQLLSFLMEVEPGQQVLDYCSGSGGKMLAFAQRMQGKGQIFLHDIRPYVLLEAKKRLKRAGIQNAQVINADSPNLKKLKKKMDWILVDAPCSGTGTLRRNPDMKWKYSEEMLQRLLGQQRMIFEKALSYLKPGGKIVYGTCSILKEENQDQIAHFMKTYDLELAGEPFQSLPSEMGMDGFFGAMLKKK